MTPPIGRRRGVALAALLLGALLVGLGRVAMLPPFEGYDETGHYSHAAQMAFLGTWPSRGDPMSAETEGYARVAPTPPSAGRRWSYAAMAAASAADRAAARAAAWSPTADPRWRAGTAANWEAQHPPLAYALLAPAFRLAEGWSLGARLLLLRSLCYGLAWAGLCCGALAALGRGRGDPASLAMLAPALWPVLLPEWFPEMARLGNDAPAALLAGVAGLCLARLPRAGRPARGLGLCVGATIGLGLLTKATFLPLAAAVGLVLLVRCPIGRDRPIVEASRRRGDGSIVLPDRARSVRSGDAPSRARSTPAGVRAARLTDGAAYGFAALAVAGWWYLGQALRTGDPIGANDGINLASGEGLWGGLRHHLSPASLLRMAYDFDLSLVWGGTWSFVVPPLPAILPMMVAFPLIVAAGLGAHRRNMTVPDAVAPLTLALFTLALVYYSLVLIAGGGLGQPAWYLHAFAPVLWPLLAWGLDAARRGGPLRALLALDLAYAPLFLLLATACDTAFYAGCAGTRGGDRYLDIPAALSCWAEPARLIEGLALVAQPLPALALLAPGFALTLLGVGLSLSILVRRPAPTVSPRRPSTAIARS